MLEEMDVPTADNCSEVDALKNILDRHGEWVFLKEKSMYLNQDNCLDNKNYQLFAVLSLWMISDAIRWSDSKGIYNHSIAGEFAMKAMDAVCYAEHLVEIEWVVIGFERAIEKSKAGHIELRDSLRSELASLEQKAKTERAIKLNVARHAKTNAAKELVIIEWERNKNQFPSAEQAGIHYADWLLSQGLVKTIAPRTVASWIREHAKLIGVKFR